MKERKKEKKFQRILWLYPLANYDAAEGFSVNYNEFLKQCQFLHVGRVFLKFMNSCHTEYSASKHKGNITCNHATHCHVIITDVIRFACFQ